MLGNLGITQAEPACCQFSTAVQPTLLWAQLLFPRPLLITLLNHRALFDKVGRRLSACLANVARRRFPSLAGGFYIAALGTCADEVIWLGCQLLHLA